MQEDTVSGALNRNLTIRVSEQELARIEELRQELERERYADSHIRVTQRIVILEALDALVWRNQERKRKRKSKGQDTGQKQRSSTRKD